MSGPHVHEFVLVLDVPRAEIDEHDPIAHTAFLLLGCAECRTVEAFPEENCDRVTPRFMRALNDRLIAVGWALPLLTLQIPDLRRAVAAGDGHDCEEWRREDGRCRLCDQPARSGSV